MDLLGKNLDAIRHDINEPFPMRVQLLLGIQLVEIFEKIHEKNIIHRDVKPNNFVLGKGKYRNRVYVIDFGLAKSFPNVFSDGKGFVGTLRYAPIAANLGIGETPDEVFINVDRNVLVYN